MSVVFKAEKRDKIGSSAAKKIKNSGRIPAVIYSKNGNINFSLDTKEFEREYFNGATLTTVAEIELDGKKIKVIAHKVEVDPVSDRPVHIDFLNCEETKAIKAQPKIVFTNKEKSPGLKRGGFLHVVLRRVDVLCESEAVIPQVIEIDASKLHLGDKIRSGTVKLPNGVEFAKKGNILFASVIGRGKSEDGVAGGATGEVAGTGSSAEGGESADGDDKKE